MALITHCLIAPRYSIVGGIPVPPLNACLACYGTAFNVNSNCQFSHACLLCYSNLAIRLKAKEHFCVATIFYKNGITMANFACC